MALYDIDNVSSIDDHNKEKRREIMISNKHIIDKNVNKYNEWIIQRKVSSHIIDIKKERNKVTEERITSFKHKCKAEHDILLAEKLIKSAADVYVNRAIEVLKEESLKGSEDECLRIIKRIFLQET